MGDFGLGLVLSFTDKASAGIYGVVGALGTLQNTVSATGSNLEKMQSVFSTLGSLGATMTATITAPIASFMGKIASYGVARASFVENTHLAFTSLMSDAQVASDYMQQLMSFAKTTPYTYESITSAAQNMITYGIDQTKILTETIDETGKTVFGGIMQALGDWAGATGRGEGGFAYIADIFGHISAEGKASLIRIQQLQNAGLQVSKIIGNMYDMSENEALQFIKTQMTAEQLIDDLTRGIEEGTDGINGATGAMAGMMMNLKNTWTGALDTFKSALKTAGLNLMGAYLDEYGVTRYKFLETMTASLNNISQAIKKVSTVLQPIADLVQNVMQKGSEAILNLANKYDALSESAQRNVAKFVSAITLIGPALLILGKSMSFLAPLVNMFKVGFPAMSKVATASMATMALSLSTFMLVWKYDLFNIRTMVTEFADRVGNAFKQARDMSTMNLEDLSRSLSTLHPDTSFFDRLTLTFLKLITLIDLVKESWNDFSLSEESYLKAKELGILPLIEAILDLKYRFEFFKEGFIQGWHNINERVTAFIDGIAEKLSGTSFNGIFTGLQNFLDKLNSNDPSAWQTMGENFAYISAALTAIALVANPLIKLFSVITTVGGVLGKIFSAIGSLDIVAKIGGVIAGLTAPGSFLSELMATLSLVFSEGSVINNLMILFPKFAAVVNTAVTFIGACFSSLASFFGLFVLPIIAAISGIILFIKNEKDKFLALVGEIKDRLKATWESIKTTFQKTFGAMIDKLRPAIERMQEAFGGLKAKIDEFKNNESVIAVFEVIKQVLTDIGHVIVAIIVPVINTVITLIGGIINTLIDILVPAISTVIEFIVGIITGVVNFISGAITAIQGVIEVFIGFFDGIINGDWTTLCQGFADIFQGNAEMFSAIFDFLSAGFNAILGVAQTVFNGIMSAVETVANTIKEAIEGAINFVIELFDGTHLQFPDIVMPHFNVSGGEAPWGIGGEGSLPQFSVDWYAKGGIFDSPNLIGVGEAGAEAVVPLERNTEWIDTLANRIIRGTNNVNNNNNNSTVVFENGAIQIVANNSTPEEARRLAEEIMAYIDRKKELDSMLQYN